MKHFYLLIVSIIMCMAASEAFAYDIAVENEDGVTIYYIFRNNGTELEVRSGNSTYAKSVNIPENVTYMNHTRKVTSIGSSAFYRCSRLTSVTIPSSVKEIGPYAFEGCYSLTSVTIPSGVTSISSNAFRGCYSLTSVTIPSSVSSIASCAFDGCSGLTSVTIPSSVNYIGGGAFGGCSGLTSVTIPSGVTSISYNAFSGCSGLKKVVVPDIAAWCSIRFGNEYANPLYYANHLYSDNNNEITKLTISSSVTSISDYAFFGCSGLTSVTIPESVTSIGSYAFCDCSGLTSVTIPEGVTSIGSCAFSSCSGLTSVSIPSSVTSIGDNAFHDCENILTFNSLIVSPFDIYSSTFSQKTYTIAVLNVPTGTKEKYIVLGGWREFLIIEEKDPSQLSGIETANQDGTMQSSVTSRYNLGGEKITAPQRGINIIKMSDGTIRKVVVR